MSKGTGYIMLDKYLAQEFKSIRREFSIIEAMFSYSLDQDKGREGSIKGYSSLWGWSRNRVRRFLDLIRTHYGHPGDTRRTPYEHPIHFIDKTLWPGKDTVGTGKGHPKDTLRTPTINPIILYPKSKEKKKIKKKSFSDDIYSFVDDFSKYISDANSKIEKADVEKSADTVDKLIRLDNHSLEYIRKVLQWAVKDDFWSGVIFSLVPLRAKSKNTLTKFQNVANGFEKKNGKNNNFSEVVYEGTKPEDIPWL